MTFLLAALAFIPAVALGFLLLHLLWREDDFVSLSMKVFLGVGAGLGISSFIYFLILLIAPAKTIFMFIQFILLALFLLLNIKAKRFSSIPIPTLTYRIPPLTLVLSLFALLTLTSFINYGVRRDQGAFDAWMIYNRAARFIYRDTTNWQATLSSDLYWGFHADYPLLISLNVASAWQTLGDENIRAPLILSGLFLFSTIGLLFVSLFMTKNHLHAVLASVVLIATPGFIRSGSGQTADVPFAFFMLASIVLLNLGKKALDSKIMGLFTALSGFFAGLAGWTKNEGLLLITAGIFVFLVTSIKERSLQKLSRFLGGLLLPLMIIAIFKSLAPSGDLFSGSTSQTISQVVDPTRYVTIFQSLLQELIFFGEWPVPILIVLGFFTGLVGLQKKLPYLSLSIIALQFVGYLAVYLITPHNLLWQIGTAFDRNMLQIFPSLLFVLFTSLEDIHVTRN